MSLNDIFWRERKEKTNILQGIQEKFLVLFKDLCLFRNVKNYAQQSMTSHSVVYNIYIQRSGRQK